MVAKSPMQSKTDRMIALAKDSLKRMAGPGGGDGFVSDFTQPKRKLTEHM